MANYTAYSYNDISTSYARNWIQYLASARGIIDNCAPGSYCPTGNLSRERLAYLLVRVFSIPTAYSPASLAQADESAPLPAAAAPKVLALPHLDTISATFTYDGDGNRVAQTLNGVTTYFVGGHYEQIGAPGGHNMRVTKYYFAGRQRVAMRTDNVLSYILGDHIGSTSLVTTASGVVISEMR